MWRSQKLIPVLVITSILSFFPGCNKNKEGDKVGMAIGYDTRLCMCCGGLLVDYQSDTLLFPEIPDKIVDWEKAYGFPLVISFDYEKMDNSCGLKWYKMTYLELLDHP